MRKSDRAIAEALAVMVDLVPESSMPLLIERALALLHSSGSADTSAFVEHVMKAMEKGGKVLFAELVTPTGSIPEARKISLIAALEKKFKKTVFLRQRADVSLLGGARLRIGDELFEFVLKDEIDRITLPPSSL